MSLTDMSPQEPRKIVTHLGATEITIHVTPMVMGELLRRALPDIVTVLAADSSHAAFEIDQRPSMDDARLFLISHDGKRRGLEALSGQSSRVWASMQAILADKAVVAVDTWLTNITTTVEMSPIRILALSLETGTPFWLGHCPVGLPSRHRYYPLMPRSASGHEMIRFDTASSAERLIDLLDRSRSQA